MNDLLAMATGAPHRPGTDYGTQAFHKQINGVKKQLSKLADLLQKLKDDDEELKLATTASSVKTIKKELDRHVQEVMKIACQIKAELEAINKDSIAHRLKPKCGKGTAVDRERMNLTNAVSNRFKELITEFQGLRTKIHDEYRETVERRVFTVTGTQPDENTINDLIETGNAEEMFRRAIQNLGRGQITDTHLEIHERHDAVKDIEKMLLDLQQIYLDMSMMIESQGDMLNDIESQVLKAVDHVQDGIKALNQVKKQKNKSHRYMCFITVIFLIVVAAAIIAVLRPWQRF